MTRMDYSALSANLEICLEPPREFTGLKAVYVALIGLVQPCGVSATTSGIKSSISMMVNKI